MEAIISDVKTSIRLFLDEQLTEGKAVDVDETAEKLLEHFPGVPLETLRKAILEVVVNAGGNASWGQHR